MSQLGWWFMFGWCNYILKLPPSNGSSPTCFLILYQWLYCVQQRLTTSTLKASDYSEKQSVPRLSPAGGGGHESRSVNSFNLQFDWLAQNHRKPLLSSFCTTQVWLLTLLFARAAGLLCGACSLHWAGTQATVLTANYRGTEWSGLQWQEG